MTLGIVRMLQLAGTFVVAGPVGLVGIFNLIEGSYVHGVAFLAAAVAIVAISEYVYLRLTDRTVGRLRRIGRGRQRD